MLSGQFVFLLRVQLVKFHGGNNERYLAMVNQAILIVLFGTFEGIQCLCYRVLIPQMLRKIDPICLQILVGDLQLLLYVKFLLCASKYTPTILSNERPLIFHSN